MISLDEIRRLMEEPGMPDEEAEAIRASCYELANIVIEDWKRKWVVGDDEPALVDGHGESRPAFGTSMKQQLKRGWISL